MARIIKSTDISTVINVHYNDIPPIFLNTLVYKALLDVKKCRMKFPISIICDLYLERLSADTVNGLPYYLHNDSGTFPGPEQAAGHDNVDYASLLYLCKSNPYQILKGTTVIPMGLAPDKQLHALTLGVKHGTTITFHDRNLLHSTPHHYPTTEAVTHSIQGLSITDTPSQNYDTLLAVNPVNRSFIRTHFVTTQIHEIIPLLPPSSISNLLTPAGMSKLYADTLPDTSSVVHHVSSPDELNALFLELQQHSDYSHGGTKKRQKKSKIKKRNNKRKKTSTRKKIMRGGISPSNLQIPNNIKIQKSPPINIRVTDSNLIGII